MEIVPPRLLVVDDNDRHRDLISRPLVDQGYDVKYATTGDQATQILGREEFDLVLLNTRANQMNVYQVLRKLKTDRRTRAVPVVVLASVEGTEGIVKCIELGADDFVTEPYHPLLVKARINAVVDRQRMKILAEEQALANEQTEVALRLGEKYERDVLIGRQIQASFLPEMLPQPVGWEIAARFQPAREVAGDWYDAFALPQINRVAVVIADVCDKGVGAALFMGLMRSLIRAFAQQPTSLRWLDTIDRDMPSLAGGTVQERRRSLPTVGTSALMNAIEQTNNYIAKNHGQTGMFATTFLGLLDPATGLILYINGGHEAPAIIGPTGVIRERLQPTGLGVGMMPDSEYTIGNAQLGHGDIMVTYTDGVPEARDPNRKFFTEKRLLGLFDEPPPSAAGLLDRIVDNVRAHIADADQYDDVTLLAVRRKLADEV